MAKMSRQSQAAWKGFLPPSSQQTLRKGLWSPEEDEKLLAYLTNKNTLDCSWTCVAKQAGLQRCGKSCRLRWVNYLRPGVKRGAFSREEERLIINLQSILGNRWSQIALHMPGRTDNEIKNYWNSSIKKKLNSKRHISYRSAEPYMDVLPAGHQTPNNTFNVVPTGQNQLCVPALLELQQEQVQDRNNEIYQLTSYFQMSMNDTSANNHDSVVSTPAAFQGSSNADNWCHVAIPGDYTGQGTRFRVAENTTDQSCPKLNFHNQFDGTEIILPAEDFQSEDEYKDSLNLRYDINMADPNYIDIYSGQKCHRRGVGDHRDCLIIPHQKTNSNPVTTISSAGRGNGPLEIECKWEVGQVTVSPHDDMYNLDIAAASELGQIYYDLDQIYFSYVGKAFKDLGNVTFSILASSCISISI